MALNTPILFLIFNRPDTAQRIFDEIRKAQPRQLFIAADGPRPDHNEEKEKCEITRAIVKSVDWKCEVKTLFRNSNLGCKIAVSSAINWFFENVEEGIILEDDCLPNASFFLFCNEMLERYRNDAKIMHINGSNFQDRIKRNNYSYGFARYAHVWGWATWRRAWKFYDVTVRSWPNFYRQSKIRSIFKKKTMQIYWNHSFLTMFKEEIDTWDVQWVYAIWNQNCFVIQPESNLISNIGFREDATHTVDNNSILANTFLKDIMFPLLHPDDIIINTEYDVYTFNKETSDNNLIMRIKQFLKLILFRLFK